MAAAASLSFISAQTAPRYSATQNSKVATGRKFDTYYKPCRPAADMHAKGRRKTVTQKKQKGTGSKGRQPSWPTEGISADIRDPSKVLTPKETISSRLEQTEPPESHSSGTLLEEAPPKNQQVLNSKANSSIADFENLESGFKERSGDNVAVQEDSKAPHNSNLKVASAGKLSEADEKAAKEDIEDSDKLKATAQDDFEAIQSPYSTVALETDAGYLLQADDKVAKKDAKDGDQIAAGLLSNKPAITDAADDVSPDSHKHNVILQDDSETIQSPDSSVILETDAGFLLQADDKIAEGDLRDGDQLAAGSVSFKIPAITNPANELSPDVESSLASDDCQHVASGTSENTEMDQALTLKHILEENVRHSEISVAYEKAVFDGRKVFFNPEIPKAGNEFELFLNRAASTLSQEPNLKVRGAYNDWKWKPFEVNLSKAALSGDWWACKLQIPKEAYKIDFVFHNGGSLYENNKSKDFFAQVENGMQQDDFRDFLIEEERKEFERKAAEKHLEKMKIAEECRLAEKEASEKVDRQEAVKQVNEQRERVVRVLQKAVKKIEGLWYFEPPEFQGGDTVKLFYNRSNRSLASSTELWMHGGYNNWEAMVSLVGQLTFHSSEGGDWWTIELDVPKQAFVLNWVLADGPPNVATLYDNNGYQDFHALVPKGVPNDLYWRDMEDCIFDKLQEEREKREEALHQKAERTKEIKAELKEKTKSILVKSREHIFYTDPVDVQAGEDVTVFYNPSRTALNGKPEIWMIASFNQWTHRCGPLPPIKMVSIPDTELFKCSVKVPLDAYMMDFVLCEREEGGGIFDNNLGKDYHVPVIGGTAREPAMKVVHISVEMAPIAKVGGLGDVVTSLSRAVQELGHSVEVILPKYDCLKYNYIQSLQEKEKIFWGGTAIKVWNGAVEGLSVIFLEPENGMFWAGCVYGRRDDGQRFGFFCHAALEYLLQSGRRPDIIHCHDWSSAPVAWLFREQYKQSNLANARVVFTIHNLEFGTALIGRAMAFTDKATTVSETYASEVSRNPAIAPHLYKFCGIRNGIDLDIWDPFNDPFIPLFYTSKDVVEGKKAAKRELQSRLGLSQIDRPLVGIITRLTAQKGIHLIKHGIWRTLERSGQVVLLGSAPDPRIQSDFTNLANGLHNSRGDMARLCLQYDEPLSHLIYAGADFIFIPSMFEPCGLTQLIAMRYGAIPVARRTGGLNDTVFDVDHDRERATYTGVEPNGFTFEGTDASAADYALNRALSAWYDAREWFNGMCKQVMEQDWSWNRPALDYIELYHNARK